MNEMPLPVQPREHTALILLGASEFPGLDGVKRMDALLKSSVAFREYALQQSEHWGLTKDWVLDLFDSTDSPGTQTEHIERFLREFIKCHQHPQDLLGNSTHFLNVIVAYMGHGIPVANSNTLALAVRYSRERSQTSLLTTSALADVIKERANFARKFIFLDCCFAGQALHDFLDGNAQATLTHLLGAQVGKAFEASQLSDRQKKAEHIRAGSPPSRGTALICAAGKDNVASGTHPAGLTLFTGALLDGLRTSRPLVEMVSLEDICDRTAHCIQALGGIEVQPEIYSTQRFGNIGRYAFFPEYRVAAVPEVAKDINAQPQVTSPGVPRSGEPSQPAKSAGDEHGLRTNSAYGPADDSRRQPEGIKQPKATAKFAPSAIYSAKAISPEPEIDSDEATQGVDIQARIEATKAAEAEQVAEERARLAELERPLSKRLKLRWLALITLATYILLFQFSSINPYIADVLGAILTAFMSTLAFSQRVSVSRGTVYGFILTWAVVSFYLMLDNVVAQYTELKQFGREASERILPGIWLLSIWIAAGSVSAGVLELVRTRPRKR